MRRCHGKGMEPADSLIQLGGFMVNRTFKRFFNKKNDNYLECPWYKTQKARYEQYKDKIIILSLLAAILFPLSFAVSDLIRKIETNLVNYSIPLLVLTTVLIVYAFKRKTSIFAVINVLIGFAGLFITLFLPNARHTYIVIFFCLPLLSFQLFGSRMGMLLSVATLFTVLSAYLFYMAGTLPRWSPRFNTHQYLMLIVAYVLSVMYMYSMAKKHENDMEQLIRGFFFDETTELPLHKALDFSISGDSEYLFFIAQISNYSDLCTIFGYEFSDTILVFFSKMLREHLPAVLDYNIFRLRGSDFGILVEIPEGTDRSNALPLLGNINHSFSRMSMPWNNSDIFLMIFMGGVIVNSFNRKQFLSQADMALKEGLRKHLSVNLYSKDCQIKEKALANTEKFNILLKNLEKDEFSVFFQPIVERVSGKALWHEALLRIKSHEGDYLSPYEYLQIAQSTGLNKDITRKVIELIRKSWDKLDTDISLNMTYNDILHPEIMDVIESLARYSVEKNRKLIIEIIEWDNILDISVCHDFINHIKSLGCLVALDDFGSGYANYSSLLYLPLDFVKIDGTLIKQLEDNSKARILIENILLFCKNMEIKVVAECVENSLIAQLLLEMGIHYLQGYYFGHPRPITEIY